MKYKYLFTSINVYTTNVKQSENVIKKFKNLATTHYKKFKKCLNNQNKRSKEINRNEFTNVLNQFTNLLPSRYLDAEEIIVIRD